MEVKKKKRELLQRAKQERSGGRSSRKEMSWNPRKEPFTKKVPVLPGAGEVWLKRHLEGSDFTGDLG